MYINPSTLPRNTLCICQTAAHRVSACRINAMQFDEPKPELASSIASLALDFKYAGTCHCGKIRLELLFPITDFHVREDNCSMCVRVSFELGETDDID